ncbi:MAG: protein kinase domain-containing protein [Myxococcota bacterium]
MIGESIGQYRIEEKLGQGGVGEVYRAVDEALMREVALKRLRPELARRPDVGERFRSEARTLARLDHPNIAVLHQFDRDGDDWFMVMEYVSGETISTLVQRQGPLPLGDALHVFVQALDGLGYAHERGIVHRDIKGSNLIVRPDGRLKIMDFGIARVVGAERLTLLGHPVGTPEYMAPEQIRGEDIDGRADIYAAGCLLHMLLTGETPFSGGSDYELMRAQMENEPPSLLDRRDDLPEELAASVSRALAKDPDERFATADEFRAALAPWLAGAAARTPGVDGSPPAWAVAAEDRRAPAREVEPAGRAESTCVLPEDLPPESSEPVRLSVEARTTRTLVGPAPSRARSWRRGLGALAAVATSAALLAGLNWLTPDPAPTPAAPPASLASRSPGPAPVAAGATLSAPEPARSSAPVDDPPRPVEPVSPQGSVARIAMSPARPQPAPESAEESRGPRSQAGPRESRASAPGGAVPDTAAAGAAPTGEGEQGWIIRRH